MAAAIEAARGARVILLEAQQGMGGLVPYGAGITSIASPELLDAWDRAAGAPHPLRTRYVREARAEVVDWLANLGVRWVPAPLVGEEGVELLVARGGGGPIVEAMLREMLRVGVEIREGIRASGIRPGSTSGLFAGRGFLVEVDGGPRPSADAVMIATGGCMGNVASSRERLGLPGARLLRGAPAWADGMGLELGVSLGGVERQPPALELYAHGVPDPANPEAALMLLEADELYTVDGAGRYLPEAQLPRMDSGRKLLETGSGWAVADAVVARRTVVRDVETGRHHRIVDLACAVSAGSLEALEGALLLPSGSLRAGLQAPAETSNPARPLQASHRYYAVPLVPTTAKALTGLIVDEGGRMLDVTGQLLPGLYAVGEVTGFGNVYDGMMVDNTMIAGAILQGRVAGKRVLEDLGV
jgi:predicted oxidoreductase